MRSPEEIKIINTDNQENQYDGVIVDSLLEAGVIDNNKPIDEKGREKSLADIKFAEEVSREVARESAENASLQTLPELSPEVLAKIQEQKEAENQAKITKLMDELMGSKKIRYGNNIENKLEVIFSPETSTAMFFDLAQKWCKDKGGRLPTIDELRYAYANKVEGFDDKTYWSSNEGLDDDAMVLNFKSGSEGLMSKSTGIYVARAADIKH